MNSAFLYSMIGVAVISAISFIGLFTISLSDKKLKSIVFILVGMSAGALFGDAFIHLVPESFSEIGTTLASVSILSGIFVFFALEKFLEWRHVHGSDEETSESMAEHFHTEKPIGVLVLVADGVHNFIDGIIVGASFLISPEVGIATTVAVILHEVPQEIGDFGLLIHSGYSRMKALAYNFLSSITSIAGAAFVFLFSGINGIVPVVMGFAAGSFIYIAGSDLVPELHRTREVNKSLIQALCMIIGATLMYALLFLE